MTSYSLLFDYLLRYDAGQPGITVPVLLQSGQAQINVAAKLDTGSSHCIFERFIGEHLGFEIEQGHRLNIGTVMGSFPVYGHTVTLAVEQMSFEAVVYFAANTAFNRNVLGRNGFLNRLVLGLNDYEGQLYLLSH